MAKVTAEQIVSAARELFRSHGFAAASMQDLADQVGIRKASLYSRFPDKSALIAAVLKLTLADLFPEEEPAMGLAAYGAALDRLAAHLRDHRRCVGLHLAYGLEDGHPEVKAFFTRCHERLSATLHPVLGESADELATETLVRMEGATLWLALHGDVTPLNHAVAALQAQAQSLAQDVPSPRARTLLDSLVGDWRRASTVEKALATRLVEAEDRVLFVEEALRGQAEAAACFL